MIVHVMGFRRSGSSALVDALVDQGQAVGLSGGYPDETALFSPGRPHSPLRYFRQYPQELDLPGLLALITEGRVGLDQSEHRGLIETFVSSGVSKNRTVNSGNFPGITYERFEQVAKDGEDVLAAIGLGNPGPYFSLVESLIASSFADTTLLVLNNDPPARHFWGANIVRSAKVMAVTRDIRGIIPDRLARDSLRGELERQKGMRRLIYVAVTTIRLQRLATSFLHRGVETVSFEEFMFSSDVRKEVMGNFGFHYLKPREKLFRAPPALKEIGNLVPPLPIGDHIAWNAGRILALLAPRPRRKLGSNLFRQRGLIEVPWKSRLLKKMKLEGIL